MYKMLIPFGIALALTTSAFAYGSGNPDPSAGDNSNLAATTNGANTSGGRDNNLHFDSPADRQAASDQMASNSKHKHHKHHAMSDTTSSQH